MSTGTGTYTVTHEQVTWIRDGKYGKSRITHPWQYIVTEPDGYQRFFDTRRQADTWITSQET